MNDRVIRWAERRAAPDPRGVVRTRLAGAGATLVRIELPAGTKAAEHEHAHEQFVEVLSGAGTLTVDGADRAFAAGDVFHFPPATPHAAAFDADTVLLEINVGATDV